MKILLVGGTWTEEDPINPEIERRSALVDAANITIKKYCECNYGEDYDVDMYNGGCYYYLNSILDKASNYDVVFWWANIPDNNLPKIRDVKAVAPHVLLVTSKRNDGDRYTFMELTQRALHIKANLFFEFKKTENKLFHINVFDPLGCHWYDGYGISDAMCAALSRLDYLKSVTRQKTFKSEIPKKTVLDAFLDKTSDSLQHSNRDVQTPQESEFINIVRKHAETFYEIFNPGKDVKRFLGNASLRASLNIDATRCMRGMPSFKKDNMIFVSQRNIDKQFISLDNFVPCYMEEGKLYYCGDNKPSVDAPIQVKLYEALPHINYIIHSHCYIEGAPFTTKPIPCGALEEIDEVLEVVKNIDNDFVIFLRNWMSLHGHVADENEKPICYKINLLGHGSLIMARDAYCLADASYIGRNLPEMI